MKRLLVYSLVLITTLSIVSCRVKENKDVIDNAKESLEDIHKDNSNPVYKDYNNFMLGIEEILKSYDVPYEIVKSNFVNSEFDGCDSIHYLSKDNIGLTNLDYSVFLDSHEDVVKGYRFFATFIIDESFKLNSTFIPSASKLLTGNEIDYSFIDDDIDSLLDSDNHFTNDYNDVKEDIYIEGNLLSYSLKINFKK